MVRRFLVAGALIGALGGATSAVAATVSTPGAGTSCAGVSGGSATVNLKNGTASVTGPQAYFNGVDACR